MVLIGAEAKVNEIQSFLLISIQFLQRFLFSFCKQSPLRNRFAFLGRKFVDFRSYALIQALFSMRNFEASESKFVDSKIYKNVYKVSDVCSLISKASRNRQKSKFVLIWAETQCSKTSKIIFRNFFASSLNQPDLLKNIFRLEKSPESWMQRIDLPFIRHDNNELRNWSKWLKTSFLLNRSFQTCF